MAWGPGWLDLPWKPQSRRLNSIADIIDLSRLGDWRSLHGRPVFQVEVAYEARQDGNKDYGEYNHGKVVPDHRDIEVVAGRVMEKT